MIRLSLVALSLIAAPASAQEGAAIVVLGEVHDSAPAHEEQARLIARLAPTALVFEMLSPGQVAAAEGVPRTDAEALAAAFVWEESGWPDFALYAPLFAAAPGAALYGAAVPRDTLRGAVTGETDLAVYDLPALGEAERAALVAEQAAAHCDALPEEMLPGMVDAQRLRDWWFADVALAALARHGPPVVVIAGTGHARTDVGIPAMIAHADPDVAVWSLGQIEGEVPDGAPFDATRALPILDRPDPCAAVRG